MNPTREPECFGDYIHWSRN